MTDSAAYMTELGTALDTAGIRGRRRARIMAEFTDHFTCDPDADLGDPVALAGEFADELGTSFALSAALLAFLALALAGILVSLRLVSLLPLRAADLGTGDTFALLTSAVAGQVSLVAGGLGLLRAARLHGRRTIPRREATVLARRAGIGLAAGAVTILAFPAMQSYRAPADAIGVAGHPAGWWWPLTSVLGAAAIVAASPAVVRAARLRPQASGESGDLLVDLGPLRPLAAQISGGSVNRLAFVLGAGLTIVISLAGIAAHDPYDGILRGLLEGGAFLGTYVILGRYLGIRH